MSPERVVQNTFWLMLVLQTIGSVDMPGRGARKLPAPHTYVAIVVLWSIFGALDGTRAGRAVAALSVLVLLTGSVVGPFGRRLVSLLDLVARQFAGPTPTPS